MPIFTYTPQWDALKNFYERVKAKVPKGYSGLAGIRLHRTGYPLTLELFGGAVPDKPLYPVALFRIEKGEPTVDWEKQATDFDIPWVKDSDHHLYRENVMRFYHAEDILEARAYKILNDAPDAELIEKAIVDHTAMPVGV